ncbi:pirin family protein [Verticiella sediminum]|uniref:Pirin family protein n=2 Tax=Verticiella sediminum TaxID=1247510 RepID=A0A556AUQ2_9BURK|nr:pirin family protein [Verticiella sediminum]
MMERTITRIVPAGTVVDDGDMRLLRALPQSQQVAVGPFVFIDHYRHQGLRGIGDRPHPHAGIEVVSYLLEGGVEHRDSMGSRDRLEAGDAQFIRAGRGMLHAEQPLSGRHGLQLWISLPPELKLAEPSYTSIRAADIPRVDGTGSRVYVVAGDVNGVRGPMALSGGAVFARLQLDAGAQTALAVDADPELSLYVLQGQIEVGGTTVPAGELALLGSGTQVRIAARGEDATEVALIGGQPVQGELLFSGPFVMDTPERLTQAKRDFVSGRMGRMEGVPY